MPPTSMIIIFHTPSNAGYAMAPLERMFYEVAVEVLGSKDRVHFGFRDLNAGPPNSLPNDFSNVIAIDPSSTESTSLISAQKYIRQHKIDSALCFDLQPRSSLCKSLRKSGIKKIISYWGAAISDENSGIKLLIKKLEVLVNRHRPEMFIFESEAMRHLAVYGRGIPEQETCVIPTGVDTDRFSPSSKGKSYLYDIFNIPEDHIVCFYSGHMEQRKGVHIIIEAAVELIENQRLSNIHFLICGNRPGEEQPYLEMMTSEQVKNKVIFAGYRNDIENLISGSDIGIIASTGWDSFPMSSLEMASSGLPIIASNLQGLKETVEDGKTGYLFETGNSKHAAHYIQCLMDDPSLRTEMSNEARKRILNHYSTTHQKNNLIEMISKILN